MNKIIIVIITFLFVFCVREAHSLEKPTHKKINETAANLSNGNNYLINELKFSEGLRTTFNNKRAIEWIQDGGEYEDEPIYTRSFNHYLNPITNTGYSGTFKSALAWAQDQGTFGSLFGGNYSWKAVREYYYIALTGRDFSGAVVAPDQNQRESYFGHTFQGLGQLMHLVEDMSVPAHTRNDAHVMYNYEKFVLKQDLLPYITEPVYFGGAISGISNLFDTDVYNGANPEVAVGNTIGLAEYTNANFFSEDTIATGFTYPKIDQNTPINEVNYTNHIINTTYPRKYYKKNCCGETNNGNGYLISAVDYLDYYRQQYPSLSAFLPEIPVLDDNVYQDYASLLLPRAVGYSAGILNYFFRAQFDLKPDPAVSGQYIIENSSSEVMDGAFSLYYDDINGDRHFITNWDLLINANGQSLPVTFTPPSTPEPKEPGKYILVFQGMLGNEEGAVAGKAVNLTGGLWEAWDNGAYALVSRITYPYYYYGGTGTGITDYYTVTTENHVWQGVTGAQENPIPDIRVQDGSIKFDGTIIDKYYSHLQGYLYVPLSGTTGNDRIIPVSECRLKINIPNATMSQRDYNSNLTHIWLYLKLTNGTKTFPLYYGILEGSNIWNSANRIWIGAGEAERGIEADFRAMVAEWAIDWPERYGGDYIGDISEWHIEQVMLSHYLDNRIDGYSGYSIRVQFDVDYIDFPCQQ